jgi:NAD-dependent dihydropyrimidine dehydrogenase PreA subunit
MSCVGACPVSALSAAADAMRLGFIEKSCVQCGLCANSCPENAITLTPRLLLDESARRTVPLKEAELFCCESCGKPMGAKPLLEAMFTRLASHSMFATEAERRRLRLCGDCRVIDLMQNEKGTKAWDLTE